MGGAAVDFLVGLAGNLCGLWMYVVLFVCVLMSLNFSHSVGVVLAFFSNEQTYNSLDDAQTTINAVADVGVNYINDTLNVSATDHFF